MYFYKIWILKITIYFFNLQYLICIDNKFNSKFYINDYIYLNNDFKFFLIFLLLEKTLKYFMLNVKKNLFIRRFKTYIKYITKYKIIKIILIIFIKEIG